MDRPRRLRSADSLFGLEETSVQTLEIAKLQPFSQHPFKLYEGQRLDDLVASIQELGVLEPILVRVWKGAFEILAGHNRTNAARLAGLKDVPVRILDIADDNMARLIVCESNLYQRSFADWSHSERALALASQYMALKSQGRRTDLLAQIHQLLDPESAEAATSAQLAQKSETREVLGDKYGLSKDSVARYIRIASLSSNFLGMLDEGIMPLGVAYQLAFLDANTQSLIWDITQIESATIKQTTAVQLRSAFEHGHWDEAEARRIIKHLNSPTLPVTNKVSISKRVYARYFSPDTKPKIIEDTIRQALELYFRQNP